MPFQAPIRGARRVFPREELSCGTFRDKLGRDVLLSLCPGTRAGGKCPGTKPSVPGRPGTKLIKEFFKKTTFPVLKHHIPVLEHHFPVLEHHFPVLEHPFLF